MVVIKTSSPCTELNKIQRQANYVREIKVNRDAYFDVCRLKDTDLQNRLAVQ